MSAAGRFCLWVYQASWGMHGHVCKSLRRLTLPKSSTGSPSLHTKSRAPSCWTRLHAFETSVFIQRLCLRFTQCPAAEIYLEISKCKAAINVWGHKNEQIKMFGDCLFFSCDLHIFHGLRNLRWLGPLAPFISWLSSTQYMAMLQIQELDMQKEASPLLGRHPPLCLPDSVDAFRQAGQRTYSLHSLAFEEKMLQCTGNWSVCLIHQNIHIC